MSPQNSIVEHLVEMHSQAVSARQLKAAEGNGLGEVSWNHHGSKQERLEQRGQKSKPVAGGYLLSQDPTQTESTIIIRS